MLKAYGAEVVVCPTAVDPGAPATPTTRCPTGWSARSPAPGSPTSTPTRTTRGRHYETTGPEIWAQTEGRITHFVSGMGTGGTISGIGRYLKEAPSGRRPGHRRRPGGLGLLRRHRPARTSSRASARTSGPPPTTATVADRIIEVSDGDSFAMTRRLAREEALLVGGSSGMAVVAALRAGRELRTGRRRRRAAARLRARLPNKIFNDEWLAEYGFLDGAERARRSASVLRGKSGETARPGAHPPERDRRARRSTSSASTASRQMPVVRAEPPVAAGEVVGLGRRARRCSTRCSPAGPRSTDRVEGHMSPAAADHRLGRAGRRRRRARSARADALLVHEDGKPVGVLTRQDLLGHLDGRARRSAPMSGFNTRAIHAGQEPDPATGAVNVPVHLSTTFKQDGVGGLRGGYEYSRSGQPDPDGPAGGAGRPRAGQHGAGLRLRPGRRGHPAPHRLRARQPRRPRRGRLRRHVPPHLPRPGPLGRGAHAGRPQRPRRPAGRDAADHPRDLVRDARPIRC